MNAQIGKIVKEILDRVNKDDFLEFTETQCEELEEIDESGESIDPLLKIFEDYPNTDFGMPGPLVHFLERFYRKGYEEKLINSINRKPTSHTLWMLNRIINDVEGKIKDDLISVLSDVLRRDDIDNETRNAANEFIGLHT